MKNRRRCAGDMSSPVVPPQSSARPKAWIPPDSTARRTVSRVHFT